MYSRGYWLKKERIILGVLTGIETFLAVAVILTGILRPYWERLDWEAQHKWMSGSATGFGRAFWNLFSLLASEEGQVFALVMLYVPVCSVLFAAMFFCLRANQKNPVTSRWGACVVFIGSILPFLIWFLYQAWETVSSSNWFRPEIEHIWQWWLYLGIFPTNVFLLRDLHRYTKAIRAEKEAQAGK